MINIGFIDYDLNNFHANTFLRIIKEQFADDVVVSAAWGLQESASQKWAEENNVTWYTSPEEVAQRSDAVVLLAPDNVEVHEQLAQQVFPYADKVYVDKPFAPDEETARRMAALAEQHGTQFFSTSALRFTPDLVAYEQARAVETSEIGQLDPAVDVAMYGPGVWPGYAVHCVETVVTVFGHRVKRLRAGGRDKMFRVEIEWEDERTAYISVNGWADVPFSAVVTHPSQRVTLDMNNPAFYDGLVAAMITFFQTGKSPVPFEETLAVVGILEKALASRKSDGAWIRL